MGPQAGSTMFLSPDEQVSVENLLHGIVTLSGNDASVVLAECIAGTEEAFANVMNEHAQAARPDQQPFRQFQRLARRGADLCHRARPRDAGPGEIENHPELYKQFYSQTELHLGQDAGFGPGDHPGQPQPAAGQVPGADGLKTGHTDEAGYGFTGSAEQNGRRLVMVVAGLDSFNQRIEESVRLMSWGFNAWQAKPLYKAGRQVGSAKVQLGSEERSRAGRAAQPCGHHPGRRAVQGHGRPRSATRVRSRRRSPRASISPTWW